MFVSLLVFEVKETSYLFPVLFSLGLRLLPLSPTLSIGNDFEGIHLFLNKKHNFHKPSTNNLKHKNLTKKRFPLLYYIVTLFSNQNLKILSNP
jgi:hypothetical protein